MTLSELPPEYKIYTLYLNNKNTFIVDGKTLENIIAAKSNFIRLKTGEGFNKAFLVNWQLNVEKTKENVEKNKQKLLEIEEKQKLLS